MDYAKPVQHALPDGQTVADVHGKDAARIVTYAGKMQREVKKLVTAGAVTRHKADRLAYKGNPTIPCRERRAAMRPGPVIIRADLVRQMNEGKL